MLATAEAKLIAIAAALLMVLAACAWSHHKGAASVQAKWDAAKVAQQALAAKVEADNAAQAETTRNAFNDLSARYEAAIHAQVPAIADSVAAGVSDGSVQLRDNPAVCRGYVSPATASSRALDAANTQALADRISHSISAVRAGDAADERERQLDAQIAGLQGVLIAERAAQPKPNKP